MGTKVGRWKRESHSDSLKHSPAVHSKNIRFSRSPLLRKCYHAFPSSHQEASFLWQTKRHGTAFLLNRWSYKERRVDALALRADERRDKLRKATGRSKYPLIRGCLNGETHLSRPQVSIRQYITYGREPGELKHLSSRRKRKKTRFPK